MTPDSPLTRLAEKIPNAVPNWPRIAISSSIRVAAKTVAESGARGVILTADGADVSCVTAGRLLSELAADRDSVTGLPRSGPLRDWLTSQLSEGKEVSVIFLDLDNFKTINETLGHPDGDAALAKVAGTLSKELDTSDFASRFGGDEFAIGSLRNRRQAEELAARLRAALVTIGLPTSIGVSGGRRAGVRRDANLVSTVEELLRLASISCLEMKGRKGYNTGSNG